MGDLDKVGSYMEYAYGELTLRGKIIANEGEIAGWVIADGDISKVGGTDDKEKVVISSADRCIRFLYDDEERVAFSADEIPAFEDIVDAGTIFGRDGFYSYWDADRFFYLTSVGGKSLIEAKGVMYFYAPSDTEVNYANIGITSAGISIMAAGTKYVTCTLPTSNPGANRLWVDTANNNVLKLGT